MFENFLVPAYVMILITFLVGFLHVFATLKLMNSDPRWADGVPSMPYPNAPDSLKLIKNNIQNLFEFPIIFYVLSALDASLRQKFFHASHLERDVAWIRSPIVF